MVVSAILIIWVLLSACQTTHHNPPILGDSLKENILKHDVILLGEKHDNHSHHLYQKEVIDFLKSEKKLGRIYMEHLTAEQQQVIEDNKPKTAEDFASLSKWQESGWPSFSKFKELVSSILDQEIIGVGISRQTLKSLYQNKSPGLISKQLEEATGLSEPLRDDVKARLVSVLKASHCGHLPPKHAEKMLGIQRYRDAYMVSKLKHQSGLVDVYLLGSGHGNLIYGTPQYFKKAFPDKDLLSIVFLEDGDALPQEDFHYFVSTARTMREDPCEKLKMHFKKSKG